MLKKLVLPVFNDWKGILGGLSERGQVLLLLLKA